MTDPTNWQGITPIMLIVGPIAGALAGMFGVGGATLPGQGFPGLLPMSVGGINMPVVTIVSCVIIAFVPVGSGPRISYRAF